METVSVVQSDRDRRATELASVLRRLFDPGEVVELRCLSASARPLSGFFTDPLAMATSALAAEEGGYAVYFGLNPRAPAVAVGREEELRPGKAAGEKDVVRRRWLLVDCDPVRPAGVCSTKEEKAAARAVMSGCVRWLCQDRGWPAPLLGDSGNGYHALFRIDLPADDGGLVRSVLQALARRFSTDRAKVDEAVFDAPRIARLYGTLNRKGEDSPDRPHRYSRPLSEASAGVVPVSALQETARLAGWADGQFGSGPQVSAKPTIAPAQAGEPVGGVSDGETVEMARAWLARQEQSVAGQKGHNQTFAAACGLVVGFGLAPEAAWDLLCVYNRTKCEPEWSERELRHKLGDAVKKAAEEPGRVGWLARAEAERRGREKCGGEPPQGGAELLAEIVREQAELWHDPGFAPYASVAVRGHRETVGVKTDAFRRWLGGAFYSAHNAVAKAKPMEEATNLAAGLAVHAGPEREVFVRVGRHGEAVYIDLGDREWQAVEVDRTGWRLVPTPPVKFRRPNGMQALPVPVAGGRVEELRSFVALDSDDDFILLVSFLAMAFRGRGPYPALVLTGRQGSGKSTAAKLVRALADPSTVPLRNAPRSDQDFAVEAASSALVVFDNLSFVPNWLSDALCRLATGAGNSARKLYTDAEVSLIQFCRPCVLNGIVDLATRPDLLERSILLDLPKIEQRKDEEEFWAGFGAAAPRILGALLDGVVAALANFDITRPADLPRMADFARWAVAAAPAFGWTGDRFLAAYRDNMVKGTALGLDQQSVVPTIREFAEQQSPWQGSMTELLKRLNRLASGTDARDTREWPETAAKLGTILARYTPALEVVGVIVERGRDPGGNRERWVSIRLASDPPAGATQE